MSQPNVDPPPSNPSDYEEPEAGPFTPNRNLADAMAHADHAADTIQGMIDKLLQLGQLGVTISQNLKDASTNIVNAIALWKGQ